MSAPASTPPNHWWRRRHRQRPASPLLAGQVVDAKEVLFEIVDPIRLAVEALAYDIGIAKTLVSASAWRNKPHWNSSSLAAASNCANRLCPVVSYHQPQRGGRRRSAGESDRPNRTGVKGATVSRHRTDKSRRWRRDGGMGPYRSRALRRPPHPPVARRRQRRHPRRSARRRPRGDRRRQSVSQVR